MSIIINPGTESRPDATEENALEVAKVISKETGGAYRRLSSEDNDGWFGFTFSRAKRSVEVLIPGDDPEQVCAGQPWKSRRLYVDGSSWLYGYAIGFIQKALDGDAA